MLRLSVGKSELEIRPSAVFFDLDDTLYDYGHPHERAIKGVRDKLERDLGISGERFDEYFAHARALVKRILGETASAHSRLLYFQRMLELLGMKSDVVTALDCEQTYWRTFLSEARLFPSVKETLLLIRSLGLPIILVSDLTAQIQFRKIVYFGLENVIDYIVTSEEAGLDKPNAAIFAIASEKAGLSKTDRIWMFGDEYEKDGVGAKMHLNALFFLRRRHRLMEGSDPPDVAFDHYDDLVPLFQAFDAKARKDSP